MIFSSSAALTVLWILGMVLQAYVLGLLIGRKHFRQYPAFTAFIAFSVLRSTVLFYLSYNFVSLYSTVMWAAYVPQLVLLLMLVLEVFHYVFFPYDTLPKGTLAHFIEATSTMAILLVALAVRYPGTHPTAWLTFLRAMDQATSWILCAIFAFIALFSSYFGIPWRHRVYGVGLGFLFYLSVDVAVTTVTAQYGIIRSLNVWPLDMLAFQVACGIWIYYFATPEVSRTVPTIEQLNRVCAALSRVGVSMDTQWHDCRRTMRNYSDEPTRPGLECELETAAANRVVTSGKDVCDARCQAD